MSMPGKYNFIYKELVTAEDDLVGLIAYGIYKKHWRDIGPFDT